jgi:hypothetical protein
MTGVDRLSVSFPVSDFNPDPTAWAAVKVNAPGTPQEVTRRQVMLDEDGRKCFVGVSGIPGRVGEWGKVEFNPSRMADPSGHGLATVQETHDGLAEALQMARQVIAWDAQAGEMRVKRLDVARDFFDVERPEFVVRGLGPIRRPWARLNLVHFDPSRNGAQTLMVGSRSGVVRLYDKHEETEGAVPEGTLRWECEARDSWCERYGGVRTMSDVSDESVERLASDRWEWSAMGHEISADERIVEQVMRSGLSHREQRMFLGHLMMLRAGVDVPMSTATAAKWNRLTRSMGIVLGDGDGTFSARLDWDSATEVVTCG